MARVEIKWNAKESSVVPKRVEKEGKGTTSNRSVENT